MDRNAVLELLQPVMSLSPMPVKHTKGTRVLVAAEGDAEFCQGRRRLSIVKENVLAIAESMGLGKKVATTLEPKTLGSAMTDLLAAKGNYAVIQAPEGVVGIGEFTPARAMPVERVFAALERVIGPTADYARVLSPTLTQVQLEVVGTETREVVRGDMVRAGTLVRFSPIGAEAPFVQAYAQRLVCANGATSMDVVREYSFGRQGGGEGDGLWQWFRQATRDSYRAIERIVARYQAMLERQIPPADRAAMLEALLREAGIKGDVAQAVREAALREPPNNEYDLLNLMTAASSHAITDGRAVWRAQNAVARYQHETTHARICPSCRRTR